MMSRIIRMAIAAGNSEKRLHTIDSTESVIEAGSTLVLPMSSVIILAPARPRNRATNEPLIAVPNFWAIVPLEKIRPVDDVPFFSVA